MKTALCVVAALIATPVLADGPSGQPPYDPFDDQYAPPMSDAQFEAAIPKPYKHPDRFYMKAYCGSVKEDRHGCVTQLRFCYEVQHLPMRACMRVGEGD